MSRPPGVYAFREEGAPASCATSKKDIQDWARHCGLTIRFPNKVFPLRSTKVMRGCLLLEPRGKLVEFASRSTSIPGGSCRALRRRRSRRSFESTPTS